MVETNTIPFCGSCGHDALNIDNHQDHFCDACGADLERFGFVFTPEPPAGNVTDLAAVASQMTVTFTFTPLAGSTGVQLFRLTIDQPPAILTIDNATSGSQWTALLSQDWEFVLRYLTDVGALEYSNVATATTPTT